MAKRNKAKFASKSRKSSLRVEALEQRQLFATIYGGGGTEVGSNITLTNGNTVDQILMTGAAITVAADPGQVVRVSFLDTTGDIVQAEFAGSGKFTITLEDFRTVGASNYNSPNPVQTISGATVNYVQGHASIFIDNPEFDTNVSVYSAGLLTLPGLFAGQPSNKQGGNHYADIARIIIVGDPTNEAAYNNFGGIRAANAIFSGSSGVIGIRAENIAVQNTVIIGDIDASGSGLPTLVFHPLSQFDELRVAGGDLVQSNGAAFNISTGGLVAFDRFLSLDGATSAFNNAQTKQQNIDSGAFLLRQAIDQNVLNLAATNQMVQMDGDWTYNLATGKATQVLLGQSYVHTFGDTGQAQLNEMFSQRTFTGNLTIDGSLGANLEINLAAVYGTLDVNGDVAGRIEANGLFAKIGKLDISGNLLGEIFVQGIDRSSGLGRDVFQNSIGSVIVGGSVGSTSASGAFILAEQIGDVTIGKDLSGLISTDMNLNGAFNGKVLTGTNYVDYEGSIGNVSITGDINNGSIFGITGVGNVAVGGNVVGAGAGGVGRAVFGTSAAQNAVAVGQSAANLSVGKIGTVTINGDVDLATSSSALVVIGEEGNYGNISILGGGKLGRVDNNDFLNVGTITVVTGFGNAANITGKLSIADAVSTDPRGTDINFGGVFVGTGGNRATGTVGPITVTGRGEDTDFVLSGNVGAGTLASLPGGSPVAVSSFIVTGFEDILLNGIIQGSSIGTVSLTPIAGVGTLDINDGTNTGVATSVTINGGILADNGIANTGETIGDLVLNLGLVNSTITLGANFQMGTADVLKGTGSKVGNITLTANAIVGTAVVALTSNPASIFAETIGNTTLTAGGGNIAWGTAYNGLVIGGITATAASNVTVNGNIGSSGPVAVVVLPPQIPFLSMGLPADRTESVGNFTLSATSTNGNVTLNSMVISDTIGTTTLAAKNGTIAFGAQYLTAANLLSTAPGSYGAISASSSTQGNINFNGRLSGATGGDVTLATLAGGAITVGTEYVAGAGGKLSATTVTGGITYNADVTSGSIGAATLTSSTSGNIAYGASSFFAGAVGDVTISTKDVGTVTYNPLFGQTLAAVQAGASAGLVNITAEKGAVTIGARYDDQTSAVGALTASTTEGLITYNAQTLGNGTAVTPALAAVPAGQIVAGTQAGEIGLVTLSTTGKNAGITINSDLEATKIAGITATTTGTGGAAGILFQGANFWAPSVGNFTANAADGSVTVDAASTFKGYTNSNGTSTAVGNISLTAAANGAVTFNGLVQATSNKTAANNTGTMAVGDLTLSGNITGNVGFNGQVLVGIFDVMSAAGKFDGLVDQGSIGKMTFNGNTTFGSLAQFGSDKALTFVPSTPQSTLQALSLQGGGAQLAQFTPGASSIGGFAVTGTLTAAGVTDTDGLIRAGSLASFTVSSNTTLVSDNTNNAAGLIFVPQLGALSFGGTATNLTAGAPAANTYNPVFVAHDIGSITFNSTVTNLIGGNVFLALDASDKLNTIGPITGTGRIVGNTVVSGFNAAARGEFEASSIGAVTISAVVDGSSVNNAVTDLDFRASNVRGNAPTADVDAVTPGLQLADADPNAAGVQPGTHAISNEAIATNGSNVQAFGIGNISITATQFGAFITTSLFGGDNSFVATGKLGNIRLVGNLDGSTQPAIFGAVGDSAWFTTGDSDSIGSKIQSGTDFDGSGLIAGTAEAGSDFTGGLAAVGDIFVNVDNTVHLLPPVEDYDSIGGATIGAGSQIDGFAVLAAVQLDTAGVDGVGNGVGGAIGRGDRIDAIGLSGRVGEITLRNGQIGNSANVLDFAAIVLGGGHSAGFGAVIAVAGDGAASADIANLVNDLDLANNGVVPLDSNTAFNAAVVGNMNAAVGINPPILQDQWDAGEVLIYVL